MGEAHSSYRDPPEEGRSRDRLWGEDTPTKGAVDQIGVPVLCLSMSSSEKKSRF